MVPHPVHRARAAVVGLLSLLLSSCGNDTEEKAKTASVPQQQAVTAQPTAASSNQPQLAQAQPSAAPAATTSESIRFIAGIHPDQRPADAPRISSDPPLNRERALLGVTPPIPGAIERFLSVQGQWFNPFLFPGMTSYYDLRGWHAQNAKGQGSSSEGRFAAAEEAGAHLRATYSPLHFKPAIESATNEQCLQCHQEILESRVRDQSPAGVKRTEVVAWYQVSPIYEGEQETFHRRHLVTPFAQKYMNLQCTTCHEGHDPRDEAPGTSASNSQETKAFTLRKTVNPETTCLKCHGREPANEIMGLPGPWAEVKETFQNNCLLCHSAIRTNRHQVNYLKAEAIEAAAQERQQDQTSGDFCYGCHGGRAWYRIAYPYPRNAWEGMPADIPEWAKGRPTQSEARFRVAKQDQAQNR